MSNKDDEKTKLALAFLNHQQYKAGFILTPKPDPFNENTEYRHLTKDFAATNLRQNNQKKEIDDPSEMTYLLKGFHPMTNPKHFKKTDKISYELVEEREYEIKDEEGNITYMMRPVYRENRKEIRRTLFPKSFHLYESNIYTKIIVSAVTNGHLAKLSITDRQEKEESVQDKTEAPKRGIFGSKDERRV
jgi:hypothetical protein